jgi:hypothetical protein
MTAVEPERPAARPPWRLIGAVVLVVVIAGGGLFAWRVFAQGGARHETQTATLDHAVTKVVFDGIASNDVSVHGRDDVRAVTVRRTLHWTGARPQISEVWNGDVLTVTVDCTDWIMPSCGIDYDVDVPAGTAIEADLTSGDIAVAGISGPVRVHTTSGDIRLTEVRSDTVSADTTSGDLIGDGLAMRSLTAESTSGDVRLTYATAPLVVKATATSGDVTVTMPRSDIGYRVRIDTTSGDESSDIGNNDNGTGEITIAATSGDVRVRLA